MNALTQWNPFREIEDVHRRLSSLFDGNSSLRRRSMNGENENITVPEWMPLVDIAEDEKEYLLKVELPGVLRDDVKVMLEKHKRCFSFHGQRGSGTDFDRTDLFRAMVA